MRPGWRIEIDGAVPAWSDAVQRIRVVEELGTDADEIELEIPDPDSLYEAPRRGVRLSLALGYARTVEVGTYVVRTAGATGPPPRILVNGAAVDLVVEALKAPRTRAWGDDLTIANVVQTIAEDHGLKALIDETLGAVVVGHIDQVGESDASRLTRLARRHDAVYKHGGQQLIMARRGAPRSLSTGRSLAGRAVSAGVLRWAVRYDARPEVARVVATYQDLDAGAPGVVEAGSGRPTKRLPTTYASEQAAMAAAEAHLAAASRSSATLSFSLAGDPTLTGGQRISVPGLHPSAAGEWIVQRVVHTLDSGGGYRSEVTATPVPAA